MVKRSNPRSSPRYIFRREIPPTDALNECYDGVYAITGTDRIGRKAEPIQLESVTWPFKRRRKGLYSNGIRQLYRVGGKKAQIRLKYGTYVGKEAKRPKLYRNTTPPLRRRRKRPYQMEWGTWPYRAELDTWPCQIEPVN